MSGRSRSAATVANCGRPSTRCACGMRKLLVTGHPATGWRFPRRDRSLAGHTIELRVHQPGALHEFELPGDVCVDIYQVDAMFFRVGVPGMERLFG